MPALVQGCQIAGEAVFVGGLVIGTQLTEADVAGGGVAGRHELGEAAHMPDGLAPVLGDADRNMSQTAPGCDDPRAGPGPGHPAQGIVSTA
ncbi:hypothetical protein [Streptomyces sp. NBC_01187]|uniref:hypothetical protein n=1 Tax=Streptomyces sp. NBC_01187 TaxID=2903766 RepID=UPI003864929A|nr:hypothetical protein OG220_42300 [Streptomyces sp. NBC_01187]